MYCLATVFRPIYRCGVLTNLITFAFMHVGHKLLLLQCYTLCACHPHTYVGQKMSVHSKKIISTASLSHRCSRILFLFSLDLIFDFLLNETIKSVILLIIFLESSVAKKKTTKVHISFIIIFFFL